MFDKFIHFLYISYLLKGTGKYDIYYNEFIYVKIVLSSLNLEVILSLINVKIDSSHLYCNVSIVNITYSQCLNIREK